MKIISTGKQKHYWYKLIAIVILSLTLRIGYITTSPPSVYIDETVIGYTAYSLSQTGLDEYGKSWPVLVRSYGAFSSTLYTFLTVPFVKTFGLNTVSIRMVSVLSGVALVVMVGLYWGLTAGLLTALTPVFIFYSRYASESNLALTLLVGGLIAGSIYIKDTNKKGKLLLSSALFAISTYAYLAERVIAPVLFIIICLASCRILLKKQQRILPVIVAIILFIFISTPLIRVSFTSGANQRLETLLPNNETSQISAFTHRYLAYYSPQNLFARPDPDKQRSFPELSVFYWWWFFPFTFGLLTWIKRNKEWSADDQVMLALLIISPLAGAVTKDYFSTLRALPMFLPLTLITTRGLRLFSAKKPSILILVTLASVVNLVYGAFLLRYNRAPQWLYPYQELSQELSKLTDKTVVIDNARLKPLYIYYSYVNKIDPRKIQAWHNFDASKYYNHYEFINEMNFFNLQIKPLNFRDDVYSDIYIVADELGISESQAKEHFLQKINVVNNLDGTIAYNIYQTNPLDKCLSNIAKRTPLNPACINILSEM